ncbi:MAG: plastocyanin/azurin family copper-binding protein [Nitrosarchaeum sp.]|jgi:plastocyanin|uniref:cupredoxin domain-containing protein n=1 Tax=Nitrosarchaeum sp. TaxID=2026886 RepID=UPI002DF3149E|nr:plastocyanin/azurin family copper-binding protein [Nitrosarchaeum sp.]MEC4848627.1 plastocyanin/azurin family copper-binding protein [Nitrosarchaeum sp.]
MANIDKAAIAFSIAIVAVGVAFAAYGGYAQDNAPVAKAPVIVNTEPKTQVDPMAKIAEEVKSAAATTEKTTELKEEVKMETEPVAPVETEPVETSEPKTVSVTIPSGTSSPGCETTNECYTPESVTINVGDTVEWDNVDTAAHTVTSGSPADGPSGVFDSSLVMGKAKYSHTFDSAGSYDYFCMVHPWMVGKVIVN